jgi:hypothetical protein
MGERDEDVLEWIPITVGQVRPNSEGAELRFRGRHIGYLMIEQNAIGNWHTELQITLPFTVHDGPDSTKEFAQAFFDQHPFVRRDLLKFVETLNKFSARAFPRSGGDWRPLLE